MTADAQTAGLERPAQTAEPGGRLLLSAYGVGALATAFTVAEFGIVAVVLAPVIFVYVTFAAGTVALGLYDRYSEVTA